jgi:hypothetical protein
MTTEVQRQWITSLVILGSVVVLTVVAMLTGLLTRESLMTILISIGGAVGLRKESKARTGA